MSFITTKLITLNSTDANLNNGTFKSDVLFQTNGLLINSTNIQRVEFSLLHAEIPSSFYNINYTNNTLRMFINGSTYDYIIQVGNYNANSLITVIKTAVNISTFNISLDQITGILTFSNTSSFQIYKNAYSTIAGTLGLINTVTSSISNVIKADFALNLLGITRLNINSNQIIASNFTSKSGQSNMLASLAVDCPAFGLILYENKSNLRQVIGNTEISQIDIQITDQNNNLVNFNNTDWTMLFGLYITYGERVDTIDDFKNKQNIQNKQNKNLDELNLLSN